MTQSTCSTGLLLPGFPHFQSNKVKRVRKPRQPPAAVGCQQPPGFLFCCLSYVTCLVPITKAPWRVRLSPQIKDFVHQNKQQFSKHTKVCFCQLCHFSIKKIKYVLSPGFTSSHYSCTEEAPVQVEQVFPNTQYLLDHSQQ